MKKCKINENHRYCNHLSDCPWCEIYNLTGKDPFPAPVKKQSSSTISQNYQWISTKNTLKKSTISISKLGALIVVLSALFLFSNVYSVYKDNFANSDHESSPNSIISTQVNNVQESYFEEIEYNYSTEKKSAWKNETYTGMEISGIKYACLKPYSNNKFAQVILDSGLKFTLRTGQSLDLGKGYAVTPKQIDIENNKVWLELNKDGMYLGDRVLTVDSSNPYTSTWNWYYEEDNVGMRVRVDEVFQGQIDSLVVIEGLWLIDFENAFTIEQGDELNGYEIIEINDNYISYISSDVSTTTNHNQGNETNYTGMRFVLTPVGKYATNVINSHATSVFDIHISDNHAYLAGAKGLFILDITNPSIPTFVGTYGTPGTSIGVTVEGNYVYAVDSSTFVILDISNKSSPTLVGRYNTDSANDVAVSGDYAYLADSDYGLMIMNMTDPAAPTPEGGYFFGRGASYITVSGNYAYILDVYNTVDSLVIVNITNPISPTFEGRYSIDGSAQSAAVAGNYAYVADGNGLLILDISDPSSPTLAGSYDTVGHTEGVAVAGNYAYVADGNGLLILDISDPSSPTLAGSYDTVGHTEGVAVAGNHIYLVEEEENHWDTILILHMEET